MRKLLINRRSGLAGIVFVLLIWAYFAYVFFNLILLDPSGNIFLQQNNSWADWALHFTQGSAMVNRSLFLSTSPILLGAPFTYPFFVNFLTAVLIKLGMPFFTAFTFLSWILVSAGISLLFALYNLILKSSRKAILSTLLFLLNGGTGIFWLLKNPGSWPEATHISEFGIEWISVINSTLIPQRAFSLGFFAGILSLVLLFYSWKKSEQLNRKTIIICGIILGSLPLLHMHTFVSLALYFFSLVVSIYFIDRPKNLSRTFIPWAGVGLITAVMAGLIFNFIYPDLIGGQQMWFKPGWMATENNLNPVIFWWRNWSLIPYLAAIGMILVWKIQPKLAPWFVGFFVIFVFGNIFALQPYLWDNTKLFAWTNVGFSALAVISLEKIWQVKRLGKFLAVLIFSFSVASGSYDAFYTLNFQKHSYLMYTAEEIMLTDWVKMNTQANSIWLTSDKHNHWFYNLTGRQPLMGYQGWLWSHGYDFEQIASDSEKMFERPDSNLELYKKYGINYVVIGPSEKDIYNIDISQFRNLFETVKTSEESEIFAVTSGALSAQSAE